MKDGNIIYYDTVFSYIMRIKYYNIWESNITIYDTNVLSIGVTLPEIGLMYVSALLCLIFLTFAVKCKYSSAESDETGITADGWR